MFFSIMLRESIYSHKDRKIFRIMALEGTLIFLKYYEHILKYLEIWLEKQLRLK